MNQKIKKKEEEINGVLMQANDLLEYRDKIIKAFKDGTFMSEHLKKSDNAAYNYVLEVYVNNSIKEIRLMEEKINLSLFKDFFEYSSPADYARDLINTKNQGKNKEIVEEAEYKISDLKDRINESKRKKEKNAHETLEIIRKILDYNKNVQNLFHHASKVDLGKLKPNIEESIAERVKLKNQKDNLSETPEQKKINDFLKQIKEEQKNM